MMSAGDLARDLDRAIGFARNLARTSITPATSAASSTAPALVLTDESAGRDGSCL
jgi:hypothetical protein